MEWISVEVGLPTHNGHVLVFTGKGLCDFGIYQHTRDEWTTVMRYHVDTDDITHWMLLPEPPKGE